MTIVSKGISLLPGMSAANVEENAEALERQKRLDAVGQAALEDSRTKLMMAFRFLDAALWRMPYTPALTAKPIAVDGKSLFFNGILSARLYRDDANELVRDYLHAIMHCVFRHPFNNLHPNKIAWDIACDIATEAAVMDIASTRFPSANDTARAFALKRIASQVNVSNPNLIYREIEQPVYEGESLSAVVFGLGPLYEIKALFERDDHLAWAVMDDDDLKDEEEQKEEQPPTEDIPDMSDDTDDEATEKDWEDIAKKIESELESFSNEAGSDSTIMSLLKLANRKQVDYADFLRRFATIGEDLRLNDEEFDNIFYTFGLAHYGNMPLIEPLEYRETKAIREFVIAIDTSGSCEGELVQSFLERTYQILCNSAEFGSTVDIHVIQCDAKIQSDVKISSLDELQRYGDEFEVRGLGGTDFQPVFAYVEDLQAQGELQHLQGLIYFTDGMGTFPKRKPPYETAFVFMDDTAVFRRVPPWAMKVVIDSEGIRSMALKRREEDKEQA